MHQKDVLSGTVDRFIYQSEENGFSVFLVTQGKETVTVRGYTTHIQPGEHVTLEGSWTMHAKFGKQFNAEKCTAVAPTSIVGLKKYLGSGLIKGIGPSYAEKLVDYFGADVLTIIEKTPERLSEVPGIGDGRIEKIVTAWKEQKEVANVMVFLQDKGVSTAYAAKIYKKYGQESIALVTENPYRLADEIWGIGFKSADKIAQQLGFEPNSIKRIRAGILFAITQASGSGHLYVELTALKNQTVELLELNLEEVEQKISTALHELHEQDKIKVLTHNEQHFITLSSFYFTEKSVAKHLKELIAYQSPFSFDINAIYQALRVPKDGEIDLNEDQQRGILGCLQNKVSVITGGPGTGKTTLIKKLLSILEQNRVIYQLAAPTGRAAKRIIEGTGRHAQTVHRLLEFDFNTMNFTRNENNALKLDFLILDEASMIDIFLGNAIIKAMPLHAHIIFIGDVHQLPSVGAGNFLHDIIESGKVACTRLAHIFRQAQGSAITVNAHRVNAGEFPSSSIPDTQKDFLFIKEDNPEMIPTHLEKIITRGLPYYGISRANTAVLVPMHKGAAGTQKLNHDMQQLLNPAVTERQIAVAGTTYKLGDRVMQLRNNYDKKVFNGDIGVIDDIDLTEKKMLVRYPERTVDYEFGELNELVLAYAISIHKSQGSEFDAAIIPIFMQHFMLLQRNLIYTAITRAKKLCILIGQPRAIAMAIKNNKGTVRVTFLKEFLTSDLACR